MGLLGTGPLIFGYFCVQRQYKVLVLGRMLSMAEVRLSALQSLTFRV